jgi:hypothetical protein
MGQRVRDEQQPRLEPERAGVGDLLDDEVSRVLDRRQRAGVCAG